MLVSEYAPDRWRSVALAVYATGYSVGATIGGALTAIAIPRLVGDLPLRSARLA